MTFIRGSLAERDDGSEEGSEFPAPAAAPISRSLAPLRDVVASLARAHAGFIPTGRERQRLIRRARTAGAAALPALLRSLGVESDYEAGWAHCVLRGVATPAGRLRDQVLARLGQILSSPRHSDQLKGRILALLSDLGAPLCQELLLRNPQALLAGSVHELLSGLDSTEEIDQAVDLIFAQVPDGELLSFLQEVAQHGGAVARPLFSALIADPRLPSEIARTFMAQYRPTHQPATHQPATRRPRPARERMLSRFLQALGLLHEGKLAQARGRLARLLPEFADQPEVHSALGLCLLRLGQPLDALAHLECARALEPTVAAHTWNHAAAAHAAQRLDTCYRSLLGYLEQLDPLDGADGRRRTAEIFCRSYEQAVAYPAPPLRAQGLARED